MKWRVSYRVACGQTGASIERSLSCSTVAGCNSSMKWVTDAFGRSIARRGANQKEEISCPHLTERPTRAVTVTAASGDWCRSRCLPPCLPASCPWVPWCVHCYKTGRQRYCTRVLSTAGVGRHSEACQSLVSQERYNNARDPGPSDRTDTPILGGTCTSRHRSTAR